MPRGSEAHVDWKHVVVYGGVVVIAGAIGAVAIWSFIVRQSLVIAPEPLPRVTIVTADPTSPLAASWVRLLTRAQLAPTLVPIETFNPIAGVVVFCDIPEIPGPVAAALDEFVRRGGAVAFVGSPPRTAIGGLQLHADEGMSDDAIKLAETVSPILARLLPGYELPTHPRPVAFLKESPRMVIDARWRSNARAAVMHMEENGSRYLWIGFDPDAVSQRADGQLLPMLRSAFRWIAGQPVSDGAIGSPQTAQTFSPAARRDARDQRFMFSVDRLSTPGQFSVRMVNRGGATLSNPTVKVWLPPRVTEVTLAGDIIMKRNARLTGVPEEGACLVSLPRLARNEARVLKLKIMEVRPPTRRASRL